MLLTTFLMAQKIDALYDCVPDVALNHVYKTCAIALFEGSLFTRHFAETSTFHNLNKARFCDSLLV